MMFKQKYPLILFFGLLASCIYCGIPMAQAKHMSSHGSYTGPGIEAQTVETVKQLADDSPVKLTGHIIQHLGGEHYLFQDATGTISVEIDRKKWGDQTIDAKDLVEIHGELERKHDKIKIDVDRVIKK